MLQRTFSTPTGDIDPFDIYRSLRVLNPSPYMYFLDLPPAPGETSRTQIAGLDGAVMTVRPLAGTRPRGRSEEEDSAFERDLLSDPKECAEHVMLIDLGRNDVGRVSEIGSVELNQTYLENRRSDPPLPAPQFRADLTPNPLSLDILLAHAGKDDRLRARGLGTAVQVALLPPRSKTIFLARMGKEDVEGEGGWGGEVRGSDLRFSRWVWFSSTHGDRALLSCDAYRE